MTRYCSLSTYWVYIFLFNKGKNLNQNNQPPSCTLSTQRCISVIICALLAPLKAIKPTIKVEISLCFSLSFSAIS